jgi:hypothetical protein
VNKKDITSSIIIIDRKKRGDYYGFGWNYKTKFHNIGFGMQL